jgi:hypothetical protein
MGILFAAGLRIQNCIQPWGMLNRTYTIPKKKASGCIRLILIAFISVQENAAALTISKGMMNRFDPIWHIRLVATNLNKPSLMHDKSFYLFQG